ncbi:unnamed protein product [Caenorhabditis angaria]|uniref:Carboxylic ester hydrolase n=1 Tax=Caenorhabditis angaria TaxID=860376 RepID=A0A9P1N6V3_9PELO|nr:unnamed protein product [Caenorhabditis angaria]
MGCSNSSSKIDSENPEITENPVKCQKYPNRSVYKEILWERFVRGSKTSEDCLYLNIFAPKIENQGPTKSGLPVLFFIHGGGFIMDSPQILFPAKICPQLVSKRIIVVTFHYRLGLLGFAGPGPKNLGLWDQLEALKWTHENIGAFGGDAENITICGHSAGAVAADQLSLSPHASGLFARKILMGGTAECRWATRKSEEVDEYCEKWAERIGWKRNAEELAGFLMRIDAEKLASTMLLNSDFPAKCHFAVGPVSDDGDFFPQDIDVLRKTAPRVPQIIGGGKYESLLFHAIYWPKLRGTKKQVENLLEAPHTTDLTYFFDANYMRAVGGGNAEDARRVRNAAEYLVNFVKCGEPGGEWREIGDDLEVFGFEENSGSMQTSEFVERMRKLEELLRNVE